RDDGRTPADREWFANVRPVPARAASALPRLDACRVRPRAHDPGPAGIRRGFIDLYDRPGGGGRTIAAAGVRGGVRAVAARRAVACDSLRVLKRMPVPGEPNSSEGP